MPQRMAKSAATSVGSIISGKPPVSAFYRVKGNDRSMQWRAALLAWGLVIVMGVTAVMGEMVVRDKAPCSRSI